MKRSAQYFAGAGALLVAISACLVNAQDKKAAPPPNDEVASEQAFLEAYRVFMHPRCLNCHPVNEAPLQGDDSHPHTQNVQRGSDGHGLFAVKCTNCHQKSNLPGANMPPGVSSDWHMPPATTRMVFEGKSPAELARQLLDPKLNGGRTKERAFEHLEADPLVLWAWAPGDGRSTPPMSHAEFLAKIKEWMDKGAAIPKSE